MDSSRGSERRQFRSPEHLACSPVVCRGNRGDGSHPGRITLRPRREVAMPEGTRDYTSSSQGLEEEQPRGAVLLLPRANSCRQTPYLSRNRLHDENQDAHPRDRLVIQRSGRSSSRGSNRNRSVEKGGGEVWFSSTRTTSDRRAGSRKERASEAFLLEQEKERKEKSQRDVGKMSLEDGGNPSGSRLQKTHKVEWLQEEEERLVNNFFRQVQQPDKRQQRGARLRPPPQEDLAEVAGLPGQEGIATSSHYSLAEHRGGRVGGRCVQTLLPPDPSPQSIQQSNSARNAHAVLALGHHPGRADTDSGGHSSSTLKGIGVTSFRKSGGACQSAGDPTQRLEPFSRAGRSEIRAERVSERKQAAATVEGHRQVESSRERPLSSSSSSSRDKGGRERRQAGKMAGKRRESPPIKNYRSERLTEQGTEGREAPSYHSGLRLSAPSADLGELSECERPRSSHGSHGLQNEPTSGKRPVQSLVDLVHVGLRLLQSFPTKEHSRAQDGFKEGIFPLPSPEEVSSSRCEIDRLWVEGIVRALNWMNVGSFCLGKGPVSREQRLLLEGICHDLPLIELWKGVSLDNFDPKKLWSQKMINSYGEEVHVARSVRWENLSDSLPKEGIAGILDAVEVCEGGIKEFILHPAEWLKPPLDRVWMKPPRVMVSSDNWDEVVEGLLRRGVCGMMPLSDCFHVDDKPILGGLFGVPKDEVTKDGVEILRLIMDLRPINANFLALGGDLGSLPMISQLFQLELQPHEQLVISSEDIRAMFYIVGLPSEWNKYLCFNKVIPSRFHSSHDPRPHVLHSRVLPMGYLNSVSIAQHLHRRIAAKAMEESRLVGPQHEIRRDRELPRTNNSFRVYLDNFDQLSKASKRILCSHTPSLTEFLRKEYLRLKIPRNEKKGVDRQNQAEMQGAWIDGDKGFCCAKPSKTSKYLWALLDLLQKREVSQKQMQMLTGGLVYMFGFRRPLMSILNHVWEFIVKFENDRVVKPIPLRVKEELLASFFLSAKAFIDFKLPANPVVTCSDASEQGGGICQSSGTTPFGRQAADSLVRGEFPEGGCQGGVLGIGAFDGISALRVALDGIGAPMSGYISIEFDPAAKRVVEASFPSTLFHDDITALSYETVRKWAAEFPNTKLVILGGGPPCQGVNDPRSSLFLHFVQLREWVKKAFHWCRTYMLMESVASMSSTDRATYSKAIGFLPYKIDSLNISPCRRPRLWWFDWEVHEQEGVSIYPPESPKSWDWGEITLSSPFNVKDFLFPGCKLAGGDTHRLPTFTTAQPKSKPGFLPAGISQCSSRDVQFWKEDRYRFPPYVYQYKHGILHKTRGWRIPNIEEREAMMFFPINYTFYCCTKTVRKQSLQEWEDVRMSLLGNSWHVGVVSFLLQELLSQHQLLEHVSLHQMLNKLWPGSSTSLGELLFRPGFAKREPFQPVFRNLKQEQQLVTRICHLVSTKGTDVLLKSSTEVIPKSHRFRQSIPPNLWSWNVICGWSWPLGSHGPEHINKLEMKAIYTSVKWRIFKQKVARQKCLHLVDSMVSLQILNKGRSSSHKMRTICKKIACLLVASRVLLVLSYVESSRNPADRPSRRPQKRKWSSVK